jgi:hypothetical protein
LGWSPLKVHRAAENAETVSFTFVKQDINERLSKDKDNDQGRDSRPAAKEGSSRREIKLELNRVEHGEQISGKLVRVELRTSSDEPASFTVSRSVDNVHLVAEATVGSRVHRGRVLPVRNRSAAQLLSREMEILCNDKIYEEALAVATDLIDSLPPSGMSRD